jgi:hypothetical protein
MAVLKTVRKFLESVNDALPGERKTTVTRNPAPKVEGGALQRAMGEVTRRSNDVDYSSSEGTYKRKSY